jgi:hypothetical protein
MKLLSNSTNLRAILFLGGIVLISLVYQMYTIRRSEGFSTNDALEKAQIAFSHIPVDDKKAILKGLQSWHAGGFSFSFNNPT